MHVLYTYNCSAQLSTFYNGKAQQKSNHYYYHYYMGTRTHDKPVQALRYKLFLHLVLVLYLSHTNVHYTTSQMICF